MKLVRWLCISLFTLIATNTANAQSAPFVVVGLPGVFNGESVQRFLARYFDESYLTAKGLDDTYLTAKVFNFPAEHVGSPAAFASSSTRQASQHDVAIEECLNRWRESWYRGEYEDALSHASKAILLDPKNNEAQRMHSLTNKVLDKLHHLKRRTADTEHAHRDVLVSVEEASQGSILFGAGFNSDAGIVSQQSNDVEVAPMPTRISACPAEECATFIAEMLRMHACCANVGDRTGCREANSCCQTTSATSQIPCCDRCSTRANQIASCCEKEQDCCRTAPSPAKTSGGSCTSCPGQHPTAAVRAPVEHVRIVYLNDREIAVPAHAPVAMPVPVISPAATPIQAGNVVVSDGVRYILMRTGDTVGYARVETAAQSTPASTMPGTLPVHAAPVVAVSGPMPMANPRAVRPMPPMPASHGPATWVETTKENGVRVVTCVVECEGSCAASVSQTGNRLHFSTQGMEATCVRMNMGRNNQMILEGDVQLQTSRGGRMVRIQAQRVVVNMQDGSFSVEAAQMISPAQPVPRLVPIEYRVPQPSMPRENR